MNYEKGGTQKETYSEKDVEYVSCPLCSGEQYRDIYTERGILKIVCCSNCGLFYVNPRLKDPEKIYWGASDKYFQEARLIFEGKVRHHRDPNYLRDIKLIHKYKPSGRFLDIGTNMGFFLRNAQKWGNWDLQGVEPSQPLAEMAKEYFDLDIKISFLEQAEFDKESFDIITMTDVFEHLTEPKKVLKEAYRILKPDGIVFIRVPNGLFNLFKLYGAKVTGRLDKYDIFDSYEHVVHYSTDTLERMLNENGFQISRALIGKPIHTPVWHKYTGFYYQYPSPWLLDPFRRTARSLLYVLSLIERKLRCNKIGYLASNITVIAKKEVN